MSPWDRSKYPDDWEEISRRVKERAGWRCECEGLCGLLHPLGRCELEHGQVLPARVSGGTMRRTTVKVVLTTAHHPDPTPSNCADDNLHALCAGCHLRLDRDHHLTKASATRAARRAGGTLPLFGEGPDPATLGQSPPCANYSEEYPRGRRRDA